MHTLANRRVAPVNAQAVGYASDQAMKEAYVEGVLAPVEVDGKFYGLPLELTNWSIFINKEVFRSAGLDPE